VPQHSNPTRWSHAECAPPWRITRQNCRSALADAFLIGQSGRVSIVRERFALLGGLRIRFFDWRGPAEDAPVLVLLHGNLGDARLWHPFAPVFASRYRVLAPDARGHGGSDWSPRHQYSPEHQARDLENLLGAVGCREVSIVGASMGARTAYTFAALAPERVNKLVIVDVSPELPSWTVSAPNRFASVDEAWAARTASPRDRNDARLRDMVERNLVLLPDGSFSWRYDIEGIQAAYQRTDVEAEWRCVEAVKAPTLLVRGAESNVLTAERAARMCRAIPDAHFIEISGAGHPVPRDQPALFLTAVAPFLFET
jgi:pimeloyl-ACP methyl ester carboxylesterase